MYSPEVTVDSERTEQMLDQAPAELDTEDRAAWAAFVALGNNAEDFDNSYIGTFESRHDTVRELAAALCGENCLLLDFIDEDYFWAEMRHDHSVVRTEYGFAVFQNG